MIEFNNITLQRGVNTLLKDTSLRINDGQKIAIIGPNGAGKSTLFALLNGELGLDAGDLNMPPKWRIAHMRQEVDASTRSALDYAMDGDSIFRNIEKKIANATDDNDLAHWLSEMDSHQGYNVPVIAQQLLHGLGFSQDEMDKPVNSFSGGWRDRQSVV